MAPTAVRTADAESLSAAPRVVAPTDRGSVRSRASRWPARLDVLQKAWFDKWLKGIDNGIDKYSPVTLKQVGDKWISAEQFPTVLATGVGSVAVVRALVNAPAPEASAAALMALMR